MTTTFLTGFLAILAALQLACFLKLCAAASALRDMRQETAARLNMLDRQVTRVIGKLDDVRDAILDGKKDLLQKLGEDHADLGDGQTSILQHLDAKALNFSQCAAQVRDIHKAVVPPFASGLAMDVASGPDMDAKLSKAMEEGIMNLMQYAAGKTPGVEVGLG